MTKNLTVHLTPPQLYFIESIISETKRPIKNKILLSIIEENNLSYNNDSKLCIEEISNILTFDFEDSDKKKNGITFTPITLVQSMYVEFLDTKTLNNISESIISDISMGNASFFVGLILYVKKYNSRFKIIPFIEKNIYGYELKEENIFFAKLSLILLSLYFGEDTEEINFNFTQCDTIEHYIEGNIKKSDILVGNPPYVKQQNIDKEYRGVLEKNFSTIASNYNLYFAFLEISLDLINKNGKIIYLLPNYLLKIKSAEKLRELLLQKNSLEAIIDFTSEKLFPGIDTYSMILCLSLDNTDMKYKVINSKNVSDLNNKLENWEQIAIKDLDKETINLLSYDEKILVSSVMSQPNKLDISTGIATQKDKLYLIDDQKNNNFFKSYKGQQYNIEKDMVRKIIKGSGASKKGVSQDKLIIYPYYNENNITSLIPASDLKYKYPNTYKYFCDCKEDLLTRSGIQDDMTWYKYGRSQSLSRFEPKIIFPTNTDIPNFKLYSEHALFFNGYAIYGLKNVQSTLKDLQVITVILNSSLIDIFMKCTSYYIGGGYVSYQKKYLEKVSLPHLDEEKIKKILYLHEMKDIKNLDNYIYNLYGLEKNI